MVVVRLSFRALGKTFHVEDLLILDLTKGREKARKKEGETKERKRKRRKMLLPISRRKMALLSLSVTNFHSICDPWTAQVCMLVGVDVECVSACVCMCVCACMC